MKKLLLIGLLSLFTFVSANAQHVGLVVNMRRPAPVVVYSAPPPVVYYTPAPAVVYSTPPAVVYSPAPVVVYTPAPCYPVWRPAPIITFGFGFGHYHHGFHGGHRR